MFSRNIWRYSFFLLFFIILGDGQTDTTTLSSTTPTSTATPTTTMSLVCFCDSTSQLVKGETCVIHFIGDYEVASQSGCVCNSGGVTAIPDVQPVDDVWVQYCGEGPVDNYTGLTTTTTTIATTTVCVDEDANGVCDEIEEAEAIAAMRCTSRVLSKTWYNVFKVLFCLCFVYILICVVATIVINCKHKNKGHHRYIHLFQEIGMIFLFLTMMALQFFFNSKETPCKILKVLVAFFMVWVCAAFMFEAFFANSMINAASKKNGSLPAVLNYLLSILIALVAAGVPFAVKNTEYTPSGLHCFAATTGNTLWGFIFPPWFLITVACFKVQTAFLQCKKYDLKTVDHDQIYWSYRSCRALPPFAWLLFGIYTTLLFGLDHQLYWTIILAVIMTFVFGPAIFFVHTYCHENTSKKWHPKFFGFYTPCPEEIRPPSPTPSDDFSDTEPLPTDPHDPAPPPKKNKPKKEDPVKPSTPPPQKAPMPDRSHGQSQHFYDWLTNNDPSPNMQEESAMILFKPRP